MTIHFFDEVAYIYIESLGGKKRGYGKKEGRKVNLKWIRGWGCKKRKKWECRWRESKKKSPLNSGLTMREKTNESIKVNRKWIINRIKKNSQEIVKNWCLFVARTTPEIFSRKPPSLSFDPFFLLDPNRNFHFDTSFSMPNGYSLLKNFHQIYPWHIFFQMKKKSSPIPLSEQSVY